MEKFRGSPSRASRLGRGYAAWRQPLARFALGIALVLAFLIAMVPDQPGPQFQQSDKLLHALAFLAFTLLAWLGWPRRMRWNGWPAGLLVYGAAIELAQWLLPWRDASLLDWLTDASGVGLGMLLIAWQERSGGRVAST